MSSMASRGERGALPREIAPAIRAGTAAVAANSAAFATFLSESKLP